MEGSMVKNFDSGKNRSQMQLHFGHIEPVLSCGRIKFDETSAEILHVVQSQDIVSRKWIAEKQRI